MPRPMLMAAWLLTWFATPVLAQAVSETADSADVLVLDHDFEIAGEMVRVFLIDKQVYRAELSSPDATLEVRPRIRGTRVLRVYPVSDSRLSSGTSVVEIYPDQDAEYEIRAISLQGSRISTRVRLYRDVNESGRRLTVVNRPGWEIGVELAGGWHSGFMQSSAAPPLGSSPDAGSDIEACFSARNAPGIHRLSMCVLGLSHQSQHGARSVLWIYTEPRFRILGRAQPGLSNWELGALFRFGAAMNSIVSETPLVFGPGVYVARHIRRGSDGSGWSFLASYSRAFYKGFRRPLGADELNPRNHRVSFGVGWYQ